MRVREPELRALVESVVAGGLDWAAAYERTLDFLEDVDTVIQLSLRWPMRAILAAGADQCLDRWTIGRRLSAKASADPDFRRDLFAHPRCLGALAACAALGVRPASYLWQVQETTTLEEEPGIHWLVLPACHLGCTPEPSHAQSQVGACLACGKPGQGAAACPRRSQNPTAMIREVDNEVIRAARTDESARRRLLSDPTAFFTQIAESLFQVPPESLGIREVRVAEDTPSRVCLVLGR